MWAALKKSYQPYLIMLGIYSIFLIFALCLATPKELWDGMVSIMTSRSLLMTDYMDVGGVGAALLNAALVGCVSTFMLLKSDVKPDGSTIMALWLTVAFSLFGKNLLNMAPLVFGVWLYSKKQKEPFSRYYFAALLSATVSPIVSETIFSGFFSPPFNILLGIALGIIVGFLFPTVSAYCVLVHNGYNLYNIGFAGGLIATCVTALFNSIGIVIEPVSIWSAGNNYILAPLLYIISLFLIICGAALGEQKKITHDLKDLMKQSGRMVDFYDLYGQNTYINMGVLCAFTTTFLLILGADLNGPTLSCVFFIVGFGCYGKHIKNCIPTIMGAILATLINPYDITKPSNILPILFSTALAPIAGQYGVLWGMVAGFLHVNFVSHIRYLNNGLNLYNNGYAAGFVALLLVPIIAAFRKDHT